MSKTQAKNQLGRFEVIVLFVFGMMFALYCVFGVLKPPSIATMLDEIGAKYGQKDKTPSTAPSEAK